VRVRRPYWQVLQPTPCHKAARYPDDFVHMSSQVSGCHKALQNGSSALSMSVSHQGPERACLTKVHTPLLSKFRCHAALSTRALTQTALREDRTRSAILIRALEAYIGASEQAAKEREGTRPVDSECVSELRWRMKKGTTSRQESSGKGDSWKLETFQMEPCG